MRAANFEQWTEQPFDLLVVGGGIVGAGIARDAAMRGLHVGLVEQNDFASGTSGRSTRLLHGGLRYLAQGRIGLVHEAGEEKRIVQKIAPHLAQPLRFLFPTYKHTQWPKWKLRMGVKLYDWLAGGKNFSPSGALSAAKTLQLLPGLNAVDLSGAVFYYDALTSDARLVMDTLQSAARYGALVANYTKFTDPQQGENGWRCRLESGDGAAEIQAACIVNATGPWSDQIPGSQVKLRLTKGVHLVLPRERLNVPDAVVVTRQNRILFAIPWGQRVYIGTTDTDYDGPPGTPAVTGDDVAYLLEIFNQSFPEAHLTPQDILSAWAGVRPLVDEGTGRPSDISRSHKIIVHKNGWIDVAGGKLTTYRLIAQQVVNRVIRRVERSTIPCRTADESLLAASSPYSGIMPPPVNHEAVAYYCRQEWACTLEDIMVRRAGWYQYYGAARETASQVARWMAEPMGWDSARVEREIEQYLTYQASSEAWKIGPSVQVSR